MASQIGKTRVYSSLDESTDAHKIQCPKCQVYAVPRGISSTRKHDIGGDGQTHCPNCGHVYGTANH